MTVTVTTTRRSQERIDFLTDVLTTAVEHGGYGFFYVDEYRWENVEPGEAYAIVTDKEDDEVGSYRIDLDLIAKGLGVIRSAELREITDWDGSAVEVLHNVKTGERLYLSESQRKNILLADRTNYDEGDLDVIDALAVVECGLFGKVVYA